MVQLAVVQTVAGGLVGVVVPVVFMVYLVGEEGTLVAVRVAILVLVAEVALIT